MNSFDGKVAADNLEERLGGKLTRYEIAEDGERIKTVRLYFNDFNFITIGEDVSESRGLWITGGIVV